MLRSLFAGISGLRSNQTMLDVTGNNIANANTIGFKSSGTVFQDTLSQMLTGASAPDGTTRGGTNPMQIGLGVQVAAITTNFNQGSAEVTGRATDLMIQGDGFFITNKTGQELYTRAGSFNFDSSGNLVSPDGAFVQGYTYTNANYVAAGGVPGDSGLPNIATNPTGYGDLNLNAIVNEINGAGVDGIVGNADDVATAQYPGATLKSYTIGSDGTLTGVFATTAGTSVLVPMAKIAMADFTNPSGLEKTGNTSYRESPNSGAPLRGTVGTGRIGQIMGGAVEMSNVDLSQEFTNLILAQRGFQASARVITTSDSVLEELVNLKRN